jgi:RimJ/RimL family protein N-acetyltransferase
MAGWLALLEAVAAEGEWIGTEAPVDLGERQAWYRRSLLDPQAELLVALVGDRVVGGLGAELRHGVVSFGMMVAADVRRTGVGGALLGACLGWARAHRAHKVALQVWPHNHAAIALYERVGFRLEGRLRRHYRRRSGQLWDALVMGLVLDEDSPGREGDELPG